MDETRTSGTHPAPILPGILLLAFGLRIFHLPDANIWWDEGLAVWAARMPLADMLRWTSVDVHPPLYFGLLHFWRMPLGDSEYAIRLFSAMAGTLAVAAVWQLGRTLYPHRPGIATLGALLLALARFPIWWSQEARMYMLGGLLFTLSLLLTVRLRRHPTWGTRISYLLISSATLWTLYTLAFTLVIQSLYWLWTLRKLSWRQRGRQLLIWGLYQLLVLATFLPWLAYAIPRMRSWSVQVAFDPKIFLKLYATLLLVGTSTHIERFTPVILLGAILILLAALLSWRQNRAGRDSLILLTLTLIIPPGIIWAITTLPNPLGYAPKPEARYLLPFVPPLYLLAALTLFTLTDLITHRTLRHRLRAALIALTILGQSLSLQAYYQQRYLQDDYKSLSLTLQAHGQAQDAIFLHTDQPWPVFAYHWPHDFKGWPHGQKADASSVQHWLEPLWEAHQGLWLVLNEDALRTDPQRLVETWLSQQATAQHQWRFGSKRLILFARTPQRASTLLTPAPNWQPPAATQPLTVSGVRVVGWEQALTRVKQGDYAHVALTLQRDRISTPPAISLSLGPEKLSLDTPPPGRSRQVVTFIPPLGGPTGKQHYQLHLDAQTAIMGDITILPADTQPITAIATPQHPLKATFGAAPLAQLLGYDLQMPQQTDGKLILTLYWQIQNRTSTSYKCFVHLIGPDGRPAAQQDSIPQAGHRPTTTWQPGEILPDTYTIDLTPLPPGDYPLRIGFYDPTTGQRLSPVLDGHAQPQAANQLQLDTLTIAP